MDLTVSIVNYNTRDLLERCLQTIYDCPPALDFEVWVVDNASHDGSVERVRENYPQVHLIASADNLGYAGGNNFALRHNEARYTLILNSDIEVHPGALDTLVAFMDSHPEAGMCGCRLILPDDSVQASCETELTLTRLVTQQLMLDKIGLARPLLGPGWLDCAAAAEPVAVEFVTGACMLCRREAIADVGLMDEAYWMYCEDSDYCQRYRARGWQLYYVPQATMRHVLGGSSKSARAEMIAAYNHSVARYFRLHHGPLKGLAARCISLGGGLLRLGLWSVATVATLGLVRRCRRQAGLFARTVWLTLRQRRGTA